MTETVSEMFVTYLRAAYGGQVLTGDQVREVRRAFYAGAHAMYRGLEYDDSGPIADELERFKRDVLAGLK